MKIETRKQLEAHIAEHAGKDVPLFTAFGEFGFISDDTLKSHHKITIENCVATGSPFIHLDGQHYMSLHDRHIDHVQAYNDNWWFTTEEEAQDYLKGVNK